MKSRYKVVPAVYVILRKWGKILLARRANTGYQDGNYNLPSGHLEEGEVPTEAAIREAKEEVGIHLSPSDLRLAHVSCRPPHDETGGRVDFFFVVETWKGEIVNMEPEKCDELTWVHFDEIPLNVTPHVREALKAIQSGQFFAELGESFLRENGVWML